VTAERRMGGRNGARGAMAAHRTHRTGRSLLVPTREMSDEIWRGAGERRFRTAFGASHCTPVATCVRRTPSRGRIAPERALAEADGFLLTRTV